MQEEKKDSNKDEKRDNDIREDKGKKNKDKNDKEDKDREENREEEKHRDERIEQIGQVLLDKNKEKQNIHLLTIIGEVEGHDNLSGSAKTTKYEHILPQLAAIEDSEEIKGVLVLLNTVGGDVEAGLAIAEMLASLSKPTVSLVLGGSHSIGVPIAVSTDYSYIVPTGTMVIHPVRMNGMVIGVPQTFDYFKQIQNRITGFVCSHCSVNKQRLEDLMMETGMLTKDVGTILVGQESVNEGIIDEVGGIKEAMAKLHELIWEKTERKSKN
ncbi:MAG: ClpP family protease [Lachnospiraceae bacterium]